MALPDRRRDQRSPISYQVDGEQYIAVYAGGTGIPYGDSAPRGDYLWAFKLGGKVAPAPTPAAAGRRRPVSGGPVEGASVEQHGRAWPTCNASTGAVGTTESTPSTRMAPTHLRVPVGTTVTFLNPAATSRSTARRSSSKDSSTSGSRPGSPPLHLHQQGEFFFNDCFSPRATGKIVVP